MIGNMAQYSHFSNGGKQLFPTLLDLLMAGNARRGERAESYTQAPGED
jgi:hypothetical protein